jgi:hypothetical protein
LLFTTRSHYTGSLTTTLELLPLSGEEGVQFLLRWARLPASSTKLLPADQLAAAQALVELVDGLPLARDQAGAYVERTGCRLTDYLHMYRSNWIQLLGERCDLIDHPQSVVKTLLLSFQQLARFNEAAADLLRLCAFLVPDALPEDLFIRSAAALGPVLSAVVADI